MPVSSFSSPYRTRTMYLCPRTYCFTYGGKTVTLRPKEYELLDFLLRNRNRVINRLTILEYVWNYKAEVETNTLEVHMAALRRRLKRLLQKDPIETVYGMGYRLCL